MPQIAIREAAMQAIATALAATATPVERNRRAPLQPSEFPRLVLLEGGHTADDEREPGTVTYTLAFTIEGYVRASEAQIGATLSTLHAKVVQALVGHDIAIGADGDTMWIKEVGTELETAPLSQSESNQANFTASFEVELRSATATGPFINV